MPHISTESLQLQPWLRRNGQTIPNRASESAMTENIGAAQHLPVGFARPQSASGRWRHP